MWRGLFLSRVAAGPRLLAAEMGRWLGRGSLGGLSRGGAGRALGSRGRDLVVVRPVRPVFPLVGCAGWARARGLRTG